MDKNIEEIKVKNIPVSSNYSIKKYKNNDEIIEDICSFLEKEYLEKIERNKHEKIKRLHILTNILKSSIKDENIKIKYKDGVEIEPDISIINETGALPFCIEIQNKTINKTFRLVYSDGFSDTIDIWYLDTENNQWENYPEKRINKDSGEERYVNASISISDLLSEWLASPYVSENTRNEMKEFINYFVNYINEIISNDEIVCYETKA